MILLSWNCTGNFNDIVASDEKECGVPQSNYLIDGFCEALEDCNLNQVPTVGPLFTWDNGRDGGDRIRERLDRLVSIDEWAQLFSTAVCNVVSTHVSDHWLLVIDTVLKRKTQGKFSPISIRFKLRKLIKLN